ncbi:MAG: Gfo/Idh/MocA family oxidoreductase [Clostridia bacterium]|nr:Gfo/Idh/MocA family oxidoreductase [Clostridia bacterium]
MNNPVVAVVGCGRIARDAHFPAFEKIGNVRVKYACDLIEEKAQIMKDKYAFVENVITDYKIALADPEVEVVFVLTPNFAHYTVTMDALRAGKHVMCEKPVTVSYDLSVEMAEEAKKQGKILNIGVCNRYQASVVKLEEMIRNGEFGNLYHVVCSFRACRSIPGLGGAFTTKSQSGGGVLIDWGIHFLDLILYILGGAKLKTLTCDAYSEIGKDMKSYKYKSMWAEDTADVENGTNDVDDFICGHVRTDKASITFNGAWAQNLDKGEMYVDFLGDKKGARLTYCKQFELFDGETLETVNTDHELPNFYQLEDADFFKSIRTGEKNRNNIDNILESMKLLDYLYKSAEEKREIAL